MKRTIYFLTVWAWFATGCTPDPIELEIPQSEKKLVVASQQLDSNRFVVVLTWSFGAIEQKTVGAGNALPSELLVRNASVTLVCPNSAVKLEELYPGVYGTEAIGSFLYETYRLEIEHPESKSLVTASAVMLPKVLLDTFSVSKVNGTSNEYHLQYAFTDLPGRPNWYVINYYSKEKGDEPFTGSPLDPAFIAKRLMEQKLDFELITEKDLINGTYKVSRKFYSNSPDTLGIALSNISQGYYEFLLAQKKYASVTNKIKGEVINMPTNIMNGYGYLTLHTPDARFQRFE